MSNSTTSTYNLKREILNFSNKISRVNSQSKFHNGQGCGI